MNAKKSLSVAEINRLRTAAGHDLRKPMTREELKEIGTTLSSNAYPNYPQNFINDVINKAQREAAYAQGEDERAAAEIARAADEAERMKNLPSDLREVVQGGIMNLEQAERTHASTSVEDFENSLSDGLKKAIANEECTLEEIWQYKKGCPMPAVLKTHETVAEAADRIAESMGL